MSGSAITPWVVGNWKMNPIQADTKQLIQQLKTLMADTPICDQQCFMGVAPTTLALSDVQTLLQDSTSSIKVVAQDVSRFSQLGAYTGEVSAELLVDHQIHHVLIGHSERRELLGDNVEILKAKLHNALATQMTVIYCVGESLEQREQGLAEQVVLQQIYDVASVINEQQWSEQIVIAYEPIWAIGTGKTATPQDAQNMHAQIRKGLAQVTASAEKIALLYGGSVKPENAVELAACPDINGALVGGASLQAQSFYQIAQAFAQAKQ